VETKRGVLPRFFSMEKEKAVRRTSGEAPEAAQKVPPGNAGAGKNGSKQGKKQYRLLLLRKMI